MTVYYLDSSALVKRYKTEDGTDVVNRLFQERALGDSLITSYLTALEVEAAAARALRDNPLDLQSYRSFLGQLEADIRLFLILRPLKDAIVADSLVPVRSYGPRAGDAVHLATALVLRKEVPEPPLLVTSDSELKDAAGASGSDALDPQSESANSILDKFRSSSPNP